MALEQNQADYSEYHHALLFGFIAKEIFERVEKGAGNQPCKLRYVNTANRADNVWLYALLLTATTWA